MNFNNFTIKSQEAIQKAVNEARRSGNQAIEPAHLMKGILGEGGSVIKFIFQKINQEKCPQTERYCNILLIFAPHKE